MKLRFTARWIAALIALAATAPAGDLASGQLLVEELNCAGCHRTGRSLHSRPGPDLSAIGSRTNAAWIYHWLENPRHFRPTASMPDPRLAPPERADIAAYLAALGAPPQASPKAAQFSLDEGQELFNTVGCLACHDSNGHSLEGIGSKMDPASLAHYLADPLGVDPGGRMPDLALSGLEAENLAHFLVQSRLPAFEKTPPAGDAMRGRDLVQSSGCLSCHTLKEHGRELHGTFAAPEMPALRNDRGCLAEKPPGNVPDYGLNATQRLAIASFLNAPPAQEEPSAVRHRLVKKFNCQSCHEMEGKARLAFPQGQSPPSLTGAESKLRPEWMKGVLLEKQRARPWLRVRMPHYGDAAAPLAKAMAHGQDGHPGDSGWPEGTAAEIAAGVRILGRGEGGLACVNCHYHGAEKPGSELLAPDLTKMAARLRPEWVRRFLWDPQALIPGTAMPAFFSAMPGEEGRGRIEQILHAFGAGTQMPTPAGLIADAESYHLTVGDKPVILRTFMPGSSTRSIAVGLPGGQNFVFDAELCRLRYAWSGGFLDVRPVWADRGGGFAKPLGKKWFTASDAFPLRFGDPAQLPAAVKFLRYRLDDGIPEFEYEVDRYTVRQRISAATDGNGIVVELHIPDSAPQAWWADVNASNVEVSAEGTTLEGRHLRLPATARSTAVIIRPKR